jgi:Acetyl-coenzyme A synthetase N-terminus
MPTYHEVYARWRAAPEAFWAEAAEAVHWYRRWDAVLDASRAVLEEISADLAAIGYPRRG